MFNFPFRVVGKSILNKVEAHFTRSGEKTGQRENHQITPHLSGENSLSLTLIVAGGHHCV